MHNYISYFHLFSVNLLTALFNEGERSFEITENKKIVEVKVTRVVYQLSETARNEFTSTAHSRRQIL